MVNREVSAADGNLLLLSVDKVAQEDARRLVWNGFAPRDCVVGG